MERGVDEQACVLHGSGRFFLRTGIASGTGTRAGTSSDAGNGTAIVIGISAPKLRRARETVAFLPGADGRGGRLILHGFRQYRQLL